MDPSVYNLELQTVGEVSVASTWMQAKHYSSVSAQSDPLAYAEADTQTLLSALKVTDLLDKCEGTASRMSNIPQARLDGLQYIYPGDHFDENGVADFLAESKEDVLHILQQNVKSTVFDHYRPNWQERRETLALFNTLTAPHAVDGSWHATALTWNASGTSIAVGYGRVDTVAWCKSTGFVAVWNVARRDFDPNTPHACYEVNSHVTAVAFHPTLPSMLAAGTYNGDVLIWSSTEQNAIPSCSASCAANPKEPISKLQWLQNMQEPRESHRYVLCSASQDGKVLFWNSNNKLTDCVSYEVQNKRRNVLGVQSLSFARSVSHTPGRATVPGVDNLMLVGVESGDVFRTKPGITAAVSGRNAPTKSPTTTGPAASAPTSAAGGAVSAPLEVDHFDGHKGPVHGLDCSPFFRNLFLTCSSDGSLRLYSNLERSPLMMLEPSMESRHFLYAAQFSPFRPGVLAAASRSGQLHIYDLEKSRSKSVLAIDAGVDGSPLLSLSFNGVQANFLATGDMKGRVRVWSLSSELTQWTELERAAVRRSEGMAKAKQTAAADGGGSSAAADEHDPIRQLFGFAL